MTRFLPYILVLFGAGLLNAQPLSMEEAARVAQARSPLIKAAAESMKSAEQAARQAMGYRLPSVDLLEIGVRTTNPAEVFGHKMNQERFSMSEFADPSNDPNNPDAVNSYVTRAEATLPLFTGGKLHAKSQQARLMARAAKLELEYTSDKVTLDVSEAWMNLGKAREYRELMLRSRDTAIAHLSRARAYYDEGMLAPNDVLRSEVYVAEMNEWVARAESATALAQAALSFQLGQSQNSEYTLGEMPEIQSPTDSLHNLIAAGLVRRSDLNAARLKLKSGKLETHAARASFLPEIGVSARYDWYDNKLFGDQGESWAVMGMAKLNLFRGGSDLANLKKTRSEANAAEADVARFEEGIQLEIRKAHGDLTSAQLRLEAATAALGSGKENLRVVEERHAQGVAKMTDLLDAQVALRELEVRELDARYDRAMATLRLRFASGGPVLHSRMEER